MKELHRICIALLSDVLETDARSIDTKLTFGDVGMDSISAVQFLKLLNAKFDLSVDVDEIYNFSSIDKFIDNISQGLDRKNFAEVENASIDTETESTPGIMKLVVQVISSELEMDPTQLNSNMSFEELGLDSIGIVNVSKSIGQKTGVDVDAEKYYELVTPNNLANYLSGIIKNHIADPILKPDASGGDNAALDYIYGVGASSDTNDQPLQLINEIFCSELELTDIEDDQAIEALGVDSISAVNITRKVNTEYRINLESTELYNVSSIKEFKSIVGELIGRTDKSTSIKSTPSTEDHSHLNEADEINVVAEAEGDLDGTIPDFRNTDIAVIGFDGSFPEAETLAEYFNNVKSGRRSITKIKENRWDTDKFYSSNMGIPGKTYCIEQGTLESADQFDPLFFNLSPKDALEIDPQQRLLLQSVWKCFESAGIKPSSLSDTKCSTYVGCAKNDYPYAVTSPDYTGQMCLGSDTSILAGRVNYHFNLTGEAISIDTACSSSTVAISQACDSLVLGRSDLSIAAGVWVIPGPSVHIAMSQLRALSPTAGCNAFDNSADGFVPGEGVGVVLLKRLEDAKRDNNHILGVIKGWGVNQDGKSNGITAPNGHSQKRLIENIFDKFSLDKSKVDYIETHGTGTKLGDPIEVAALKSVYQDCQQPIALGSVKANIGHLAPAAGIASFIKVLLCINNRTIPPVSHFSKLNEHINLDQQNLYIPESAESWTFDAKEERLATVSSFGYSGTNAHLVVANSTATEETFDEHTQYTFLISASDKEDLKNYLSSLEHYVRDNEDCRLDKIQHTLANCREVFSERISILAKDRSSLIDALRQAINDDYLQNSHAGLDEWKNHGTTPSNLVSNRCLIDENLPKYAFKKERYWLESHFWNAAFDGDTLYQTHRIELNTDQPWLKDHVVKGTSILPAAAYLTIIFDLVKQHCGDVQIHMIDGLWLNPIVVSEKQSITIDIQVPGHDGYSKIAVTTGRDTLHFECYLTLQHVKPEHIDIPSGIDGYSVTASEFYQKYQDFGFEFGHSHRVVNTILLDTVKDSATTAISDAGYLTGSIDGILQSTAVFNFKDQDAASKMPFSFGQLEVNLSQLDVNKGVIDRLSFSDKEGVYNIYSVGSDGYANLSIKGFKNRSNQTLSEFCTFEKRHSSVLTEDLSQATYRSPSLKIIIGKGIDVDIDRHTVLFNVGHDDGIETVNKIFSLVKSKIEEVESLTLFNLGVSTPEILSLDSFTFSLAQEYPEKDIQYVLVEDFGAADSVEGVVEGRYGSNLHVRSINGASKYLEYQGKQYAVKPYRAVFNDDTNYLVTGGFGEIGRHLVHDVLTSTKNSHVYIIGRTAINFDRVVSVFGADSDRVHYISGDIGDLNSITTIIESLTHQDVLLGGVIHCAGVAIDNTVVNKSVDEFQSVLSPKVIGLKNLDYLLRNHPLQTFVCISSVAAMAGNFGQTDYAFANSFLDYFTSDRNRSDTQCRYYSIQLPYINDGGILLDDYYVERLKHSGSYPISVKEVLQVINSFLQEAPGVKNILFGDMAKINSFINGKLIVERKNTQINGLGKSGLSEWLLETLSESLGIEANKLDMERSLETYGVDSVKIMQITDKLEEKLGRLSKTLFFEFQTAKELIDYIVGKFGGDFKIDDEGDSAERSVSHEPAGITSPTVASNQDEVVIIGVSGVYPGSDDLMSLWENLSAGKDLITEIPTTRWPIDGFYSPERKNIGTSYSKWGGFIDDYRCFDPMFFGITPRDAIVMDPQERLYLQVVYSALESSGYTKQTIDSDATGLNNNVGVFTGVMYEEYQLYGAASQQQGKGSALSGSAASISNRVSYFFNFSGPSMTLDTMCSSSLTSIHLAKEALLSGGCKVAIAGGVNLNLHKNKYLMLAQGQFSSSKGRCESFGEGGDGYVPGEGVGAVVLKLKSQAIKDRDTILATVKGSAINHGGKTNGYSVPNPKAQRDVIAKAFANSDLTPADVDYIEAHGTGTSLGDPIEIDSLDQIFQGVNKESIPIGSIKSNIGHCESSAGIAAVTKVLLQFQKNKLVPSLHSSTLNSYIDFDNSKFEVNQSLRNWSSKDGSNLVAGISGFGAGGSNAHILLEKYTQGNIDDNPSTDDYYLIPISSEDPDQLIRSAHGLIRAMDFYEYDSLDLKSISYTLCHGREHFESRTVFVANSIDDLRAKLDAFVKHGDEHGVGSIIQEMQALGLEWSLCQRVDDWLHNRTHQMAIAFSGTYRRVPLQSYPFKKEEYWFEQSDAPSWNALTEELVNTSSIDELSCHYKISKNSRLFSDHVVDGSNILSATAFILIFKNVASNLLKVGEYPVFSELTLYRQVSGTSNVDLKISVTEHAKGRYQLSMHDGDALVAAVTIPKDANIDARMVNEPATEEVIDGENFYQYVDSIGFQYRGSYSAIDTIFLNRHENFAKVISTTSKRPEGLADQAGMLDTCLQGVMGFNRHKEMAVKFVPVTFKNIKFYRDIDASLTSYIDINKVGKKSNSISVSINNVSGDRILDIGELVSKSLDSDSLSDQKRLVELIRTKKDISLDDDSPKFDEVIVIPVNVDKHVVDTTHVLIPHVKVNAISGDVYTILSSLYDLYQSIDTSKRVLIKLIGVVTESNINDIQSLSGFVKTANQEYSHIQSAIVEVEARIPNSELFDVIGNNLIGANNDHLVVEDEHCYALTYTIGETDKSSFAFRDNGVYLIFGGAGFLGLEAAKYIRNKNKKSHIVLLGRSDYEGLDAGCTKLISELGAIYKCCDLSSALDLERTVNEISENIGVIKGVIHAAGIIEDSLINSKDAEGKLRVLDPKVKGTVNIDEATKNLDLDIFLVYTSVSGVFGNIGQSDYATANAYQDSFVRYRKSLVDKGIRSGLSKSISWPLFENGGMDISDSSIKYLEKRGIYQLPVALGYQYLDRVIGTHEPNNVVIYGIEDSISSFIGGHEKPQVGGQDVGNIDEKKLTHTVLAAIERVTKIPAHKLSLLKPLDQYGLDSVTILEITNLLEERVGEISQSVFFEVDNIGGLVQAIISENNIELRKHYSMVPKTINEDIPEEPAAYHTASHEPFIDQGVAVPELNNLSTEIAIVGVAGRYPGSNTLNEFWENLAAGIDLVGEPIANKRFVNTQGKPYWGGLIEHYDCFDSIFFNISPREAEIMDPQERVFLETAYHALEAAGYAVDPSNIYEPNKLNHHKVGVYVGVMYEEYQLGGTVGQAVELPVSLGGSPASIANRVSYIFNLNGPSFALDTMCSSSLTSVHLACQHLISGETSMALAGGVNLNLSENKYIMLDQGNFLSSKGRCETFSADGDGYVPSEGVGCVVLKRLEDAIKDNDQIYAVINGSAVNHGGRTNGYTVPNAQAQAEVITDALRKSKLTANDISYIEAHGTGTALGDPIEVKGLELALGTDHSEISIGSVKSNIGHCESAAGIAALTKCLLQLQNQTLVPSIHYDPINERIDWSESKLKIQKDLIPWQAVGKRVAGVSGFGAGGSNCHIVMSEYQLELVDTKEFSGRLIVPFSAKSPDGLSAVLRNVRAEIMRNPAIKIQDVAYTYQTCKPHYEDRKAFIVESTDELLNHLEIFLSESKSEEVMKTSDLATHYSFLDSEDFNELLGKWIAKGSLGKICTCWEDGHAINWDQFDLASKGARFVALESYPFKRVRHYYNAAQSKMAVPSTTPLDYVTYDISLSEGVVSRRVNSDGRYSDPIYRDLYLILFSALSNSDYFVSESKFSKVYDLEFVNTFTSIEPDFFELETYGEGKGILKTSLSYKDNVILEFMTEWVDTDFDGLQAPYYFRDRDLDITGLSFIQKMSELNGNTIFTLKESLRCANDETLIGLLIEIFELIDIRGDANLISIDSLIFNGSMSVHYAEIKVVDNAKGITSLDLLFYSEKGELQMMFKQLDLEVKDRNLNELMILDMEEG